jgi:hypothetical protein
MKTLLAFCAIVGIAGAAVAVLWDDLRSRRLRAAVGRGGAVLAIAAILHF